MFAVLLADPAFRFIQKDNSQVTRLSPIRILLLTFGLIGCSDSAPPRSQSPSELPSTSETTSSEQVANSRIRVIATYSILSDWVQHVGGDDIQIDTLVGPGGDAHTYEPVPQDSVALANAQLVFENGLGFELWLDQLFEGSQTKARRIVVTAGFPPRTVSDSEGKTEPDPHVWHDPQLAEQMVRAIAAALSQTDPPRAASYQQRADEYIQELKSLDSEIRQQVAAIPTDRRQLVTTHDTFGYFAERYGFQVSSVMGTISSEAADPSAAQIAEIVNHLRSSRINAVFAENILNPQVTEQVAAEAGVKIVRTLFTDALGDAGSEGDTYLKMMRSNVSHIVEALR